MSSLSARHLRTQKNCIKPFYPQLTLASKEEVEKEEEEEEKTVEKSNCIFNDGHSAASSRVKVNYLLTCRP